MFVYVWVGLGFFLSLLTSSYDAINMFFHVLWECPAYSSLRDNFLVALQETLGDDISSHLVVSRRHPLCLAVSCGRISMVLCLTILDVWDPSVQQPQSQIAPGELRGVASGGELCLEGETDTGISSEGSHFGTLKYCSEGSYSGMLMYCSEGSKFKTTCRSGSLHCNSLACQNGSLHCYTVACQNGTCAPNVSSGRHALAHQL